MYIDDNIYLQYNSIVEMGLQVKPAPTNSKEGVTMAISKAQQKATAKYVKNAYDRIEVKVPKGQKAVIQSFAEGEGKSLNSFACEAINEKMERDGSGTESGNK